MAVAETSLPKVNLAARNGRKLGRTFIYHLIVAAFGFVMIYPILWLFASSLKSADEIWTNASSLIPQEVTFRNYLVGWAGFGGVTFTTFFTNSFIYAGVVTVAAVFSSAVVAYGFARIQFVGRNFWFSCMMITLMLPVQVQIIPQYIVFSQLDWVNTFKPLLIPHFFGRAFFIFLMKRFTSLDNSKCNGRWNARCSCGSVTRIRRSLQRVFTFCWWVPVSIIVISMTIIPMQCIR